MAALPYMQLYVADYLSDTFHLETEEHGAYLLILMTYWQKGEPLHESRLAKATKLSNERWKVVSESLIEFFDPSDDGYWIHHRIERDLKSVNDKSIKASMAGKASAAKRAASKATETKGKTNKRSTDVKQTCNHTDTEAYTDTNKTYTPDDLAIAETMFKMISELMPKTRKPNFDKWANTIRLMREIDNIPHADIARVFTWANKDSFWQTNILSPTKFREKYSQLEMKARQPNEKSIGTNLSQREQRRAEVSEHLDKRIREAIG